MNLAFRSQVTQVVKVIGEYSYTYIEQVYIKPLLGSTWSGSDISIVLLYFAEFKDSLINLSNLQKLTIRSYL